MQICVSDIFLLKVLTKSVFYRIIIKVLFILRGVAQLVARQFWELDVAGSSPVTPLYYIVCIVQNKPPLFMQNAENTKLR